VSLSENKWSKKLYIHYHNGLFRGYFDSARLGLANVAPGASLLSSFTTLRMTQKAKATVGQAKRMPHAAKAKAEGKGGVGRSKARVPRSGLAS
jgi:hypothetical protein